MANEKFNQSIFGSRNFASHLWHTCNVRLHVSDDANLNLIRTASPQQHMPVVDWCLRLPMPEIQMSELCILIYGKNATLMPHYCVVSLHTMQLSIRFSAIKIQFSMIYLDDVRRVCVSVWVLGLLNANSASFDATTTMALELRSDDSIFGFVIIVFWMLTHTHSHAHNKQVSFKWKTHNTRCCGCVFEMAEDERGERDLWKAQITSFIVDHYVIFKWRMRIYCVRVWRERMCVCVSMFDVRRAKALIYFQ